MTTKGVTLEAYRAEFLVEPFTEGQLGPPVVAGIEAAKAKGFAPEVGPFGTTIVGSLEEVSAAVADIVSAALAAGATRVSIQTTPAVFDER